ncbi:hypothetical protein G6F22_020693 [Rhizopus arrhizus]|nr:hypothetical protein G6F22_020693 [Rhizopus arrhizus]
MPSRWISSPAGQQYRRQDREDSVRQDWRRPADDAGQHVQADEPPGQAGGAGSAEHAEAGQGVHGEHQCHAGLGRVPAGQYRKGDA